MLHLNSCFKPIVCVHVNVTDKVAQSHTQHTHTHIVAHTSTQSHTRAHNHANTVAHTVLEHNDTITHTISRVLIWGFLKITNCRVGVFCRSVDE